MYKVKFKQFLGVVLIAWGYSSTPQNGYFVTIQDHKAPYLCKGHFNVTLNFGWRIAPGHFNGPLKFGWRN